jgi:hypothetical protein
VNLGFEMSSSNAKHTLFRIRIKKIKEFDEGKESDTKNEINVYHFE